MNLSLNNQNIIKEQINPKLLQLKEELEKRKIAWDKIPLEKRKRWIQANKDPLMGLAWSIYKYLRNNFFGSETDEYL